MSKFTLRMLAGLTLLASLFFWFGIAQANAATANCPAGTANGQPSNVVTDNTSYYEFDLNAGTCSAINNGTTPSSPLHGLSFAFYNFHTSGVKLYVQVNNPDQPHDGGFTNVALSGSGLALQSGSPGGYFYDCSSGCTINGFNTTDVNGNTISVSAITITQSGAYSISPFAITYVTPPIPAVTSISPSSGVSNGGTTVTITGTGFVGVTSVNIGGSPVTSYTVNSSTQITAVTEAHGVAAGVSVDVSNANGSNAANTLFTYTAGTCSAGTSATLSMLGTALNVNQAFNVDTLLGVSPSVPGSGGIYVTCAADTTLYPPDDVSPTTPGSISITGASGGVYTLGYDLAHITADDAAGTYPHYVLKVTTAPPAGTDTLTTYYYSGAGVGGPYGPPTDKTFVIHLTNVVTVGPTMIANAGTTPQSATVNTAFTNPVAVTVKDASNNPVSGVNVTFTAPGSGASGTFSNSTATITVATNASGIASAPFTANTTAGGPYTVTASAATYTTVNFSMTNTGIAMTANAVTTPQSATINTAFTNALAVTLKDASSNPISGINVTFTAPGSGASGIFSNSTNTITVATNASGIASAPFTANATAGGPYAVTTAAAGVSASVNFSMTNTPITMTANPGTTPQSATVNTAFANAVAVTVKDVGNNPVSGVNVTFTAPGSGASGKFSNSTTTITVATNASGVASAPFTANTTAGGPYTVSAAALGATTVNFSMTNTPGAPSTMAANAATTPQSTTINTAFATALGVTVEDASSNPVPGVSVTFTAPGSGASGTFSNATVTITVVTNASGIASAPFSANATAGGPYTVTAATAGLTTVNFSMTNAVGAPSTMTANAGTTPQSATISTAFTNALGVTVKDVGTNPVPGVNVTFTAPGSGASGTFSNSTATITVATNASGVATAPFTANANAGGPYTVTAATAGVATVNFSMTNTKAAQAITFGANPGPLTFAPAGTFAVSATGGASGNAVTFASITAAVCTVSGGTVSMVSAGTCTITADQASNANYTAAPQVSQNITISQASQAITFGANPGPLTYTPGGTFAVSATGGASGNAVTFLSSTAAVCTISGSTVSMVSAGTCTIAANQLGNVNYTAAPQVSQNITISQAAQTVVFTSTPPAVVAAGGATYTASATGGASGNAVTFSIDGASGAGVCSIAGSTVSFLTSGTCIVDANQAGNVSYAAAVQVQQTIIVQNGVGPTVIAIAGFLSDRNNAIVTNMWNMDSTIDRLNDAPGGGGSTTHLNEQDEPAGLPQAGLRSGPLASQNSSQSGTVIPAMAPSASGAGMQDFLGLQQMVYGALRQLGETQGVSQLNYSGPFSAQMSTSGDMTGTFHTSLSQIMKWNDQAQQKEAASMGLNTSSSSGAHQFNPLDVWMQGTYAAINSTQQAKFGLISSGVDYVFNRNLLLGFYGQVDFMNQTTGLQVGGTGWLVGPYGTMRLTDQIFLEARGGYGRSANAMTDALDPTLTDQFGSTRWLASAALAGRWQLGDHVGFKPNFSFTYFTDTTDAYVNGLSVSVPSVNSQLGQFKFSPEVTKGFSLGDANWYEASLAPELIYNFTSNTADGLGAIDPTATGPQGLRGAIKWGLSMKTPKGITVTTQGSYDGIGSGGYSAITGEARVNVPLN